MRSRGIKFDPAAARRILNTARYVEQQPRNSAEGPAGPSQFGGGTMLLTTTTIARGAGNTPGTGSGKIQDFDGTRYSDLSTATYPILNDTTALVASGAYVLCIPGPGGKFHFVMTSCGNIS